MWFIGDVHGQYHRYESFCLDLSESIQVGDMGVGFPDIGDTLSPAPIYKHNHKFICGNHDDYKHAIQYPNCLGRFGYIEEHDIFYISGGFSIDKQWREPNVTWWDYEELSGQEQLDCIELYEETKPSIVCSHECPTVAKYWALFYSRGSGKKGITSPTETTLNVLWSINQPKYWIHGHFHQFYTKQEGNTLFVGLDELMDGKKENCIYEINT